MAFYSGVQCDRCKNTLGWMANWAKKYVIRWARNEGWSFGKQALCPDCRKAKKI
jgi:arsenate reductase-like glutaredoxin family protein